MTGTVHTFTVVRIGMSGPQDDPYAVIVADVQGARRTGRADGDLSWLAVGAPVELDDGPEGLLTVRPPREAAS